MRFLSVITGSSPVAVVNQDVSNLLDGFELWLRILNIMGRLEVFKTIQVFLYFRVSNGALISQPL